MPPSGGNHPLHSADAAHAQTSPPQGGTPNNPSEGTTNDLAEGGTTGSETEPEENIYQVMKQHMARKKEEIDAQNAQRRQGGRPGPRPGSAPMSAAPAPPSPAPQPTAVAADLTDLPGVWAAARQYLAAGARTLESVLGSRTEIESLNVSGGEVTLLVPEHFKGYTNDRARAKLEEALRAVTRLPLRLKVNFGGMPDDPSGAGVPSGGGPNMPMGLAQRIPPELLDAVNKQPLIQELMKRLDATVTQVEILEDAAPGAESEK